MRRLAGVLVAALPGCLALRDDLRHLDSPSLSLDGELRERQESQSEKKSCSTCPTLVTFAKHVGFTWSIFPPSPMPSMSGAITCLPSRDVNWGPEATSQVEAAIDDEDCGLGEAGASLSSSEKKDCRQLHAKQSKRASWLGVPVGFLQQMAVCGRCTVCEAFSKVRSLWRRLKAAISKVAEKLRQVKRMLFGYSYASSHVRSEMARRFDSYFPDGATSALQTASYVNYTDGESGDIDDAMHEKMVEEALLQELRKKSPEQMDQHLSLLQQRLEEVERKDEELMRATERQFQADFAKQRSRLEIQLPTLLGNEHCQAFVEDSMASRTLQLTLFVSVPNVVGAVLNAVAGNFVGALYALVPGVFLSLTPNLGHLPSRQHHMDKCLEALNEQREPYLDSCTHEQPLMACTARTFQRLMQGALSQQWWPLMHNEVGTTVGSIDLGYSYDELMKSLECSSRGSCLERGLDTVAQASQDLKAVLENTSADETARLEELQCAFAGNRIDTEDAETGKLPVFSDKIWAAALKAHGQTMENAPVDTPPCPNMVPFVVAFCADSLRCMDTDRAGQGLGQGVFEVARARAEERIKEFQNITRESTEKVGPDKTEESDDSKRLKDLWRTMLRAKVVGLQPEEDVYQWNLLWQAANFTNKAGRMATWPAIRAALDGEETEAIDWVATRNYWQRVLVMSAMKLNIRQKETAGADDVHEERSLPDVLKNLRSIFDTKFCSPGALGGLTDETLYRLGVKDEVSLAIADMDKQAVVVKMWKLWAAVNVKVSDQTRLQIFKDQLQRSSCSCMCYDACGKLQPSGFVHCPNGFHQEAVDNLTVATLHADKVILDRVYAHGAKYQNVELSIVELNSQGSCQHKLEMRYSEKGKWKTLSGYIAQCNMPDFVVLSEGLDLRITLWEPMGDDHLDATWETFLQPNQHHSDVHEWAWERDEEDSLGLPY